MAQNMQSAADAAANQTRRRKQFVPPAPISAKRPPKVPKASQVEVADKTKECAWTLRVVPPSTMLTSRLGSPEVLIGFDIETHSWLDDEMNRGRIGRFGWYTLKEERVLEFARIVQLGWVIGRAEVAAPVSQKVALIQPDGFEIAEKATTFHKISQATAAQEGRPLADVLREFMEDVLEWCDRGGRVVAHQLEYDAGIILNELARCGLHEFHDAWKRIAQKGFCTMDYEVGRWVYTCAGQEVGPETAKHSIGLEKIVPLLKDPLSDEHIEMLKNHHHQADVDAQLTRLVYAALLARAKLAAKPADQH